MANTTITRTPSGAGNKRTWTLSFWMKKCENGDSPTFFINTDGSGQYGFYFLFGPSDEIKFGDYTTGGNWNPEFLTNRKFRDNNAWYHFVLTWDTTQSTESDRIKLYVNGVQETSFSTSTYPSQNYQGYWNGANQFYIGSYINTSNYFNGCMSHIHFIDGTAYDASAFGQTNSTTGEWSIKTSPSVTYGTNGFFILKDGNSVTDQSGNSNNFTVASGTLTKTEDNPSNVFSTLNPLVVTAGSDGLFHGNTQQNVNTSAWRTHYSTIGASSGKYYFESYIEGGTYIRIGARNVDEAQGYSSDDYVDRTTNGYSYDKSGLVRKNDTTVTGGDTGVTYTTGDIIGCLLDLDNWTINWTKNGTLVNSTAYNITQNLTYVFGVSGHSTARIRTNFGNGYFQTTAVSSAGTNASNNGIFEYDVPTGYTALSTKGLNL